jgi:hypothetical protein
VVVINQYDTAKDKQHFPKEGRVSFNYLFQLVSRDLLRAYPNRKIEVTCGFEGDIAKLSGLGKHLAGLARPVEKGKVVSYDTVGHGSIEQVGVGPRAFPEPAIRLGVAGEARVKYEYVLRDQDVNLFQPRDGRTLGDTTYAGYFSPFLSATALVGLHHCSSGTNISTRTLKPIPRSSLAHRLQRLLGRAGADRDVLGYDGMCELPTEWLDRDGDGQPGPGEARGWQPHNGNGSFVIWARER